MHKIIQTIDLFEKKKKILLNGDKNKMNDKI